MNKMKYSNIVQLRAGQPLPSVCFMLPLNNQKDSYTLIEQSTHLFLLKLGIN